MPTTVSCPECHGAKQVHVSRYDHDRIANRHDEIAWRAGKLNSDYTCKTSSEAVLCRVCWGVGYL